LWWGNLRERGYWVDPSMYSSTASKTGRNCEIPRQLASCPGLDIKIGIPSFRMIKSRKI
jgi:hypothetical protein